MVVTWLPCVLCQSSISLVHGDTKTLASHLASEHNTAKEETKVNKQLALLLAIHFLTEAEKEGVMKMAESRMVRNRIVLRRSLGSSGESSTCISPTSSSPSSSNSSSSSSPTPPDSIPQFSTPTALTSTSTPVSTPITSTTSPTTTNGSPEKFTTASPALFSPPMPLALSARRARYSLDSSVALRVSF